MDTSHTPPPLPLKHARARLHQARALADLSSCSRRKVAALIIDPRSRALIADGYNGPPRRGPALCGGLTCIRDTEHINSGEQVERGCYHAEANALLNAARHGHATEGAVMITTAAPCLSCSRMIYHAGIEAVYSPAESYPDARGAAYLERYDVTLYLLEDTHTNTKEAQT